MKRNDGAYVLVKRYKKETFKEHRKGNGTEDYYEPEYDSKNPTEFVQKVINLRNSLPVLKNASVPDSPINEVDDHTWKYEAVPLDFKATREKFEKLDLSALLHIKKDLIAVISAGEDFARLGLPYSKLGFYIDELHTLNDEIRKRDNKSVLKEEGESTVSQIVTTDSAPFQAYAGLLKRK